MKYIIVSGGVLSGIGKGVISSSLGLLLRGLGYRVTAIKIDPYLNIDAGTMSPFEHGEVFVLADGGEVDLDLGNYERLMDIQLSRDHNITTGKIYKMVIDKERKGEYLGKTVQVVPHICDAIQDWIERAAHFPIKLPVRSGIPNTSSSLNLNKTSEICVIELGGTVGDIESGPFIEALRQFQFRVGKGNFCSIHVSLVPEVGSDKEQKTKPTQHAVRLIRGLGITPNIVVCRSKHPLTESIKNKISQYCHISPSSVIGCHNVSNLYKVPMLLLEQKLPLKLSEILNLPKPLQTTLFLKNWAQFVNRVDDVRASGKSITIAIVGKYTGLTDSYHSLIKALEHAGLYHNVLVNIRWVVASNMEKNSKLLENIDGILVPGGFGDRGVEGKVNAIRIARSKSLPFLGICLGMQVAVIQHARDFCGFEKANSTEFSPNTPHPVVIFMPEGSNTHMGNTMRLGERTTVLSSKSITSGLYGTQVISERHRHRYEVNPKYVAKLEEKGLHFVGKDSVTGNRMEVAELSVSEHPFFLAVQFHPEYLSRPCYPSPCFLGFVGAIKKRNSKDKQ